MRCLQTLILFSLHFDTMVIIFSDSCRIEFNKTDVGIQFMKQFFLYIGFLFLLLLAGCAVKQPEEYPIEKPEIRVGLLWGQESVDFSVVKTFRIVSYDGSFTATGINNSRWRAEVKESTPSKMFYFLLAASTNNKDRANAIIEEIGQKGFYRVIREDLSVS